MINKELELELEMALEESDKIKDTTSFIFKQDVEELIEIKKIKDSILNYKDTHTLNFRYTKICDLEKIVKYKKLNLVCNDLLKYEDIDTNDIKAKVIGLVRDNEYKSLDEVVFMNFRNIEEEEIKIEFNISIIELTKKTITFYFIYKIIN